MRMASLLTLTLIAALGCALEPTSTDLDPALLSKGKGGGGGSSGPVDPTATWLIPLDDAGLAFRSDGRYPTGAMSEYASGVCGVYTRIFATTEGSNSGDATISLDEVKGKNACSRRITIAYPDRYTETVRTFNNLRKLQNTTLVIPVGDTQLRTFALAPNHISNNPSRCGRLVFGVGDNGFGVGSDPVWVHREDARTWHIQSQNAPNNRAWCEQTGELFEMPVAFTIVASRDLPE